MDNKPKTVPKFTKISAFQREKQRQYGIYLEQGYPYMKESVKNK